MSTIDKTGGSLLVGQVPYAGLEKTFVMKNTVDLTAGAIVQGDVYQVLAVPVNTLVESVHIRTDTAATGTTLTMDVGDGGSAAGWIGSTDGKATAGVYDHSTYGTDARAVANNSGYFYGNTGTAAVPTSDTIDVTMTTASSITVGPKFTIWAICTRLN
jgi:hypothetical protein